MSERGENKEEERNSIKRDLVVKNMEKRLREVIEKHRDFLSKLAVELSDSESFSVTVNAVNDAPVATTGISATTDEDQNIVITISGNDVDGNSLEFTLDV